MTDETKENREKEIARFDLLTPREIELIGGTREEGWSQDDVPVAIIKGESIERVARLRKERLAHFHSAIIGFAVGYDRTLVINFPDLDTATGKVLDEPKFIGFWDDKDRRFLAAEDPENFDQEVKKRLKKEFPEIYGQFKEK